MSDEKPPDFDDTHDGPSQTPVFGIPGSLPPTFCFNPKCNMFVHPIGKGQCPRCKRVVKGGFLGRVHKVNLLRKDQLNAEFLREYQAETQYARSMCDALATVVEQLESSRAGSAEYQRLATLAQQLGNTLEAARKAVAYSPNAIVEVRRVIVKADGTPVPAVVTPDSDEDSPTRAIASAHDPVAAPSALHDDYRAKKVTWG
jgi:hypothetical protein